MAGMRVSLPGVRTWSSGQGGPSFQPLPKMFQEGALRLKKATGLSLQGKGCKLRYLQGQENSTRSELAGESHRLI